MKKYAVAVTAAILCNAAFADARIEIDQNGIDTFHAPFDADNTDNETKSMPQAASSVQNDDAGVYYGDAMTIVRLQRAALRTIGLVLGVEEVTITSDDTYQNGTLRVDGTNYSCRDWSATHKLVGGATDQTVPESAEVEISVTLTNCS